MLYAQSICSVFGSMLYVQSIIVLSVWEHAVRTVHVFSVWVNGVEISAKVHTSPCVQYLEACQ